MTATVEALAAPGPSETVPVPAKGLELLGPLAGSGYERQPWLVRRADGQTLQMTPLLYAVLEAVDGRRTDAQIAQLVGERIGRLVDVEDVRYLIDEKLRALGVLQAEDGSPAVVARSNPLLTLRWRLVVSNPEITRRVTGPFAALFRPHIVLPMLVAFALTSGWLLLDKGLASATHQALYQPGVLLLIFGLTILSAGWHEFGHAAACRYGGATPGAMGVGLYLVWPAFYTDVNDCYRLGRWGRVRVDVGGLYFNAIFAVGMLGVWAATGWDAMLLVIPAQLLQMLRQLLPFVRFDGYHILADLTGVPDLFAHVTPTLSGLLPGRRRRPEAQALKRWARVVVRTWVLLVIPVLAASLVLMVTVLPRIAVTAWDSLGLQYDVLQTNWSDGAWSDVAVRLLSMFTIALPLASITYLLARIVRRTARRLWRMAQARRAWRVGVILGGIAAAGLVAWLWWPDGQVEPIRADERGTVLEPFQPGAQQSAPDRMLALAQLGAPQAIDAGPPVQVAPAAPGFRELASAGAQPPVDWVTGAKARPRLGIVLTPRPERTYDDTVNVYGAAPPEPVVLLAPEDASDVADLPVAAAEPSEQTGAPPGTQMVTAAPPVQADDGWAFPFDEPREARAHDNQARAVNTRDGSTVYDVSFAMVWVTDGNATPVDHRNDAYALASCTRCGTVAVAFQIILVVGQADVVAPQNVSMAVNHECVECTSYALAVQLIATLTRAPSAEAMAQLDAVWEYARHVEAQIPAMAPNQIHAQLEGIEAAILDVLLNDDGGATLDSSTVHEGGGHEVEPLLTEGPTPTPTTTTAATATPTAAPSASPSASAAPSTSPGATPHPTPTAARSAAASPSPQATPQPTPAEPGSQESEPPPSEPTAESTAPSAEESSEPAPQESTEPAPQQSTETTAAGSSEAPAD